MASFDIITAAGLAYRKVWVERAYLLRMAMLPFVIKLGSFTVLASYGEGKGLWVSGMILLPAFFLEGWLLSHWARTVMTGTHRWPFRSSGDEAKDMAEISIRGRGIMAGTVSYVLINFLITGYIAALLSGFPDIMENFDPQNPDPRIAMMGAVLIITSLLLFRFIWVYIPLSLNLPLGNILEKLKLFPLTFQMIGLWLVCVIPSIFLLQILGGGMLSVSGNAVVETGLLVIHIALDMIKNLICTAGMAYAFLSILKAKKE